MDKIKLFFLTLASATFWRGIGWALVRTAIAGIVPFVPALVNDPIGTLPLAASTVAMLLIVAALTSVRGIPDPEGAPWFVVLASRFLRQFAQFASTALAGAALFEQVQWSAVLGGALASAITTALIYSLTVIPGTVDTAASEAKADDPLPDDLVDIEADLEPEEV